MLHAGSWTRLMRPKPGILMKTSPIFHLHQHIVVEVGVLAAGSHPVTALEERLRIYNERLQQTGMLNEFCKVLLGSLD